MGPVLVMMVVAVTRPAAVPAAVTVSVVVVVAVRAMVLAAAAAVFPVVVRDGWWRSQEQGGADQGGGARETGPVQLRDGTHVRSSFGSGGPASASVIAIDRERDRAHGGTVPPRPSTDRRREDSPAAMTDA
jgi:hypothetical protein